MRARVQAAKPELDFTGERIVPEADNCEPTFASRMYQEHIARYLFASQLTKAKSVIDIGCGVGYGSHRLAELGASSIYAFDLSEDAIQHARKHYGHPVIQFESGNAEQLKMPGKFDVAVCFELIEHVKNPRKVLANIKRALNPNGILVISTPRSLEQKRTHFHEHEFALDEFESLIMEYFPNVEIYSENNHFSSLVTKARPTEVTQIECIKDQFAAAVADVFVVVASLSSSPLTAMKPTLVLDDDAYVRTLERDVEILHKAEDDLKERVDAIEAQRAAELAFKDRELERLTSDFKTLFANSEMLKTNLWMAEQQNSEVASKDAEIDRLTGEYKELFTQTEKLKADLWDVKQSQSHGASNDAEIARLTTEYKTLFQQSEELKISLWNAEKRAADSSSKDAEIERLTTEYNRLFTQSEEFRARLWQAEQKQSEIASKDAEIARLTDEYHTLFARSEELSALLHEAEKRQLEADAKQSEIVRLTSECNALREQSDDLSRRLQESEMKQVELQQERQKLNDELELLTVRCADADARRMDAYEFARVSSNQVLALRRELEILRRDLENALDHPSQDNKQSDCDSRYRDIVTSMERLFLGTEATHDIARDPIIDRVSGLALDLREQMDLTDRYAREIAALQEFQRHAEDWHRQLLKIRKSASWRITAPLRWATKPFRVRAKNV